MEEAGPATQRGLISRRRLLAAGALTGTAAVAAYARRPTSMLMADGVLASYETAPPLAPAMGTLAPAAAQAAPAAPSLVAPTPPPTPAPDASMRAENLLRGSDRWDRMRQSAGVSAYLAAASVGPGEPLVLRARGSGTVDVEWYRLGWYGGRGGRLLKVDRGVRLRRQAGAHLDRTTGLVEARWEPVLRTAAPTGVKSGMLLAVLRSPSGHSVANVPIVLRPDPTDARRAPLLFVSAAATWQAYNTWGGIDLYVNPGRHPVAATGGRRAAQVSFDRPYTLDSGAGLLRRWELQFIRWMERNGRDVEYIADVDLERNPDLANGRRLIVMAGHPEYWTRPMRSRLEASIASGTNVAFLTANEVYWQARLEDGPAGPGTRITCYKSRTADPLAATQPGLTTCRWRDAPVSDPEAPLIGQMYGHIVRRVANWIVTGQGHWLYEGTGLRNGEAISNLVGQEFDTYFADFAQPGTELLARSPVEVAAATSQDPGTSSVSPIHTSTIYTAQSGATVFAAGTIQWSWALDDYGAREYKGVRTPLDERVSRMTRNLFDRLGDGPLTP